MQGCSHGTSALESLLDDGLTPMLSWTRQVLRNRESALVHVGLFGAGGTGRCRWALQG
jgi:hypothetical protein